MMENENVCNEFRCPEFVPANAPDDFCIPEECCPDKIPQPKFPSPNSCLSEEELEEVEANLEEVNNLLLDLGLSGEREPNEIFKEAFDGLVGQQVIVKLNCPSLIREGKNMSVKGRVYLVGQDFVLLKRKKSDVLVRFKQVLLIKLKNRYAEPESEARLNDIDPCFRRRLTFNFGEVVSSSPELIQLFFRLNLKIYLMLLIGETVKVSLDGRKMKGKICEVHDESFTIKMKKKEREIPMNNVCKISLLKK
ncbi:ribosome maturation factor RimP [Bacillus mesophilus]|uniref:Ribosome maturation factor RimP C-terminal domain-containing protein n=1 Tax=Bacillus mesophilus TaxID=1808955 RepID=A0A6M0Q2H5_9BACI|nr:hypothetical protein [Bacillus mesophilus]MBM7659722.1 ribosome maturation factor RimP [Bacillus mesophilus]NEY70585.1 hypothetical protein [Bacillus mesophilus]